MSNLLKHAENEFRAAGWVDDNGKFIDDMQEVACKCVIDLLEVFSKQGHSGSSASYVISLVEKLARFKPIVPLTGEDWEWIDVGDGVFQNKRSSDVFKQADRFNGQAYHSGAIVFWEWYDLKDGTEPFKSYFTNRDSSKPIEFPYTPSVEYIEWQPSLN
jgi:hypothetical protein